MKALAAFALLFVSIATAQAENWPAWRGPTGQGLSEEKNLPLKWDDETNVKWVVPLEHQGNSTPVIWGDKIFMTQANKGGTTRSLLCLAKADGKLLWQKDVSFSEKEKNWTEDWYCNASPTVDGERVVVSFGSAGMYCYDYSGEELWKRTDLGVWQHAFGNSASPVFYNDLAILWCGPDESKGRNYLLAVNKKTGETVWNQEQSFGSWSTPLLAKVDGKDQLIVGYSRDVKSAPDDKTGFLRGFNPQNGEELWKCQGLSSFVYTSALYSNNVAVAMSGYGGSAVAVKLGGTGDITKDRLWKQPNGTSAQRVGSGVIVGDHIYIVEENGIPHCYNLQTGEEVWKAEKRPGGGTTWGSTVYADGRLYVLMRNAETLVFAANPKYELLAKNSLGNGQSSNSSVAISDGALYLRTFKNLWCISER